MSQIIQFQPKYIYPKKWKAIVRKVRETTDIEFCPRMILMQGQGNCSWNGIDITNWKLYWNIAGEERLLTIKECEALPEHLFTSKSLVCKN